MICLKERSLISRFFHTSQALLKKTPTNLKNKKHSSQLWLIRQIRDPFVELAKKQNYRCRSAFKLLEINERFKILSAGQIVIDCGAAPGSWTQVAVRSTNADGKSEEPKGFVYAVDKQPMHKIDGASMLGGMDFTTPETQQRLLNLMGSKKADVVLSDMAPNASGIREADHYNIMQLAYTALKFAVGITKVNGSFLVKVWDGGMSHQLEEDLNKFYRRVRIVRPKATRDDSTEKFLLAREFKGLALV